MEWPYARGVLGVLAFYVTLQISLCADPCRNYKSLSHENRVISHVSTLTDIEECDRYLVPAWYRIDGNAASDLVSHCPDLDKCGTLFPVWLNGSTPSESEGIVNRIACKRGLSDDSCCESEINIKLKNCGSFRVAYLNPLDGCPGKYCFEYKTPCPPGQSSETGFTPCTTSFAHLSNNVKAKVEPFTNSSEATRPHDLRLYFHCNRIADVSSSSYFYDVNWYIDGQLVKTFSKVSHGRYNTDTALGEEKSWRLPMMVSPEGVIQVDEGSTGTVYFQSTIPVPCITTIHGRPFFTPDSCQIHFESLLNETKEDCSFSGSIVANIQLNRDCGFKFNANKWNSRQALTVRTISDGTTAHTIRPALIRLSTSTVPYPLWSNYKLPDIKVTTKDRNRMTMSKICKAWTDVRIDPFDGLEYKTNNPGLYLLYKHTQRPIEVMIITEHNVYWTYDGTVTCAVSIKAGDDIYMIYICNRKYIVKRLGCEHGNNLDVKEQYKGQHSMVVLPTGTTVQIQHHMYNVSGEFLSIEIQPSPDDIGKVTGLCGNVNGAREDSSVLVQRHRLGDAVDSDVFVHAVRYQVSYQICMCPTHGILVHTNFNPDVTCNWKTGVRCTRMSWNDKPCHKVTKRDAHLDEEDWKSEELINKTRLFTRVARSTWTLTSARDKCLKVFEQYASFNKCRELSGVDIGGVLDVCAEDVVASIPSYLLRRQTLNR